MSGCTPYTKTGGVPPAVCVTAAEAPYAGNAQLQQLAYAALLKTGCYVQNGGVLTPPAYGTIGDEGRNNFRGPAYYNIDLNVGTDWHIKETVLTLPKLQAASTRLAAALPVPASVAPAARRTKPDSPTPCWVQARRVPCSWA